MIGRPWHPRDTPVLTRSWERAFGELVADELRAVSDLDVVEPAFGPVVPGHIRVRWADCEFLVRVDLVDYAP